jgi:hypothetical protein
MKKSMMKSTRIALLVLVALAVAAITDGATWGSNWVLASLAPAASLWRFACR